MSNQNQANQANQPYNQYSNPNGNFQQGSSPQQFSSSNTTGMQINPNQNVPNVQHQYSYHQQGSQPKNQQGSLQFSNNNIGRHKGMYSSTIEPSSGGGVGGLGKLESLGRFVGGNGGGNGGNYGQTFQQQFSSDSNNQFNAGSNHNNGHHNFLPQNKRAPPRMAASFMMPSSSASTLNNPDSEFDRFPAFNVQENSNPSSSYTKKPFQPTQPSQPTSSENIPGESAQEKRRREILAIKQELQNINRKMQSSNLTKKYGGQDNGAGSGSSSSNQLGGNNSMFNLNNNNTGENNSYNNSTAVNTNRNKGMIAQSMIVSNEPLPGYKPQQHVSIFDKYDSLKKPQQYEQDNNKPLFLDKFASNSNTSYSSSNNSNSYSKNTAISDGQTPPDLKKALEKNDYSTPSSTNVGGGGGGMFKKKPAYVDSSTGLTDFAKFNTALGTASRATGQTGSATGTATNNLGQFTKNNFQQTPSGSSMFKKNTSSPYVDSSSDNMVTRAMKNMNIQENVQFKKSDFNVGKSLGKGQFGEVMVVQHKKTGFICGMKVMEKKQIKDEKYEGQITRELSIQFYLAHRNITPLYGYFQDTLNVYLLIEYCTGGQLLQMLRKNRRMEQPEVSRVIKQIIEGIDYIHKELIIHRDIKPENILFNFGIAKICDFGWAVYKGHGMRKTASVGSPLYYSPEIVMGVEYDEKIDIWDIGMMTYECLLGKIPFRIYSELDLNRIVQDDIVFPEYIDTTAEAKDFILKIMKKKPEERMEIREMLRHPFITKYQDVKLSSDIMKDFKEVLTA